MMVADVKNYENGPQLGAPKITLSQAGVSSEPKFDYGSTLGAIGEVLGKEGVSALDIQHGGDHYAKLGEYQPYCVLQKWMTPEELKGFAKGSAIAYLAREQDKGGREDIKKAVHHLQLYLEVTKGAE
jgi:hypothetical protein